MPLVAVSTDVDDAMAVCMANALADRGEVDIRAIVHNVGIPWGVGAISSLLHWYGRGSTDVVAVGGYKGTFGRNAEGQWVNGSYVLDLVANFSGPVTDYDQVPDALTVYRSTLAAADDRSIHIASIGFTQNIAELLQSPPDSISPLSGHDLVAHKVAKVVWMGGGYPPLSAWNQTSFNFCCGLGAYAHPNACDGGTRNATVLMPDAVTQVFSDIGPNIYTGGNLTDCAPAANPCRQAIIDRQGAHNPRKSWDPVVTMMAIRGLTGVYSTEAGQGGRNMVDTEGRNTWHNGTGSNQTYLVLKDPVDVSRAAIENEINALLCAPPTLRHAPGSLARN